MITSMAAATRLPPDIFDPQPARVTNGHRHRRRRGHDAHLFDRGRTDAFFCSRWNFSGDRHPQIHRRPQLRGPTDAGGNNVYDVTVQVSDGTLTDTQAIAVTVTDVNDNAPVITSTAPAPSPPSTSPRTSTAVTTVTASDVDASSALIYSISGGADAAKFIINAVTGELQLRQAAKLERPTKFALTMSMTSR